MSDREKKAQLIEELQRLRQRVAELEASEAERKRAEEALRESKEHYRSMVESIDIGLNFIDCDHNLVMVNAAQGRHFNKPPHEMVGRKCFQEFEKRDAVCPHCPGVQAIATGQPVEVETEGVRDDGSRFNVRLRAFPVFGQDGTVRGFIEVGQDITERKQVEEALRVSEERFALAVRGSNDGIWDWDIVNNTLYWSPRLKEFLGYADDELDVDFDTFDSLLHPDDKEHTGAAIDAHLKDRELFDVEQRLRTKSGQYRWVRARGQALWDEDGQPLRMVGSSTDITERKRAEEALAEERSLLRTVIDNLPDYIYVKDTESRYLVSNTAHVRFLGATTPDEVVGKSVFELYPQELAAQYYADDQEVIQSGQPLLGREERSVDQAGNSVWLLTTKVPLRDSDGKNVGLVGIARDITERKQAGAERERLLAELGSRALQLQTAADVSRAAGSILDPDELIQQVVDLVGERFNLYYAGLFLVDATGEWNGEPGRWAVLRAGTGEAGRKMLEAGHKLEIGGESMIGQCVARGEARIALDVGEEAVRFDNPLLPETRSEMALPLVSRGQVIGAMTIQSAQEAAFSEEDITVLQTMADQLANAIENARLYEETQRRVQELAFLNEASRTMTSSLDLEHILTTIIQEATDVLKAEAASVLLLDDEGRELVLETVVGPLSEKMKGLRLPLGQGIAGWVAREGQLLLVPDVREDPRFYSGIDGAIGFVTKSVLAVPLKVKGKVIGVIEIVNKAEGAFGQADVEFLSSMTQSAAIAIENARLFEQTQQTSFLMGLRVRELACLNDIGRKVEETPPVLAFLQWVTARIPPAMQYPHVCLAAIEFEGQVYGAAEAVSLPRQIVQALRIGGKVVGRMYISYTEEHGFLDEESALLGDIVRRVSGYIESRRLFEQTQQTSFLMGLRVRELACLNDIGRKVEETPPVPEFLQWLTARIPPAMQYPHVCLAAIEFEGQVYGAVEAVRLPRQMVQALRIGGKVVGRVYISYTEECHFLDEESALLGDIVRRVSGYIESRHLFKETQQRAEREHTIHQISDQMQRATDMETLMRITAEELNRALGGSRAYVRLGTETQLRKGKENVHGY